MQFTHKHHKEERNLAIKIGYRINRLPEPRKDGSGEIGHDIEAVYSLDDGETWVVVPGKHRTVLINHGRMNQVMNMPDKNEAQRRVKLKAYKAMVKDFLPDDWDDSYLQNIVDGNEEAIAANQKVTTFLNTMFESGKQIILVD